MTRYTFDRPDPSRDTRMRDALAHEALGGSFAADTYKERVRAKAKPVADAWEVEASRRFNRAWKRRKPATYPCAGKACTGRFVFIEPGTVCYWCRQRDGDAPKRKRRGRIPGESRR